MGRNLRSGLCETDWMAGAQVPARRALDEAPTHARFDAPPIRARVGAAGALAVFLATLALLAVFTISSFLYVLASVLCGALGLSVLWTALTNRRYRRLTAALAALLLAGALASLLGARGGVIEVVVVIAGMFLAAGLGALALRWDVQRVLADRWHEVPATSRGVIFVNPKSGGGKAMKYHLPDEARGRGIKVVMLEKGDDLRSLAEAAVADQADALGVAGGDGSQAIVAAVAAATGLPYICIPAGTRNHLALDLGIDRDRPLRALDAFGRARETFIDLAEVNGHIFVNNVSLGIYASIIASEDYRDAKRQTVTELLPDLLAPGSGEKFAFSVDGPDGPVTDASVIEVSNNPYRLSSLGGFGSRPRLDSGALGVAALSVDGASDINRLVALEATGAPGRYKGWRQWSAPSVVVNGPAALPVALDGEVRTFDPPLRFEVRPRALRARIAFDEPGASPALLRPPLSASTITGLVRVVCGKPADRLVVSA
jgi:diacylglycerol kinase family enzyme